jgi:hypothetical protein
LVWGVLKESSVIVQESFHGSANDIEDKPFQTYDNFLHFAVICFIIIDVHDILRDRVVSKDFRSGQADMVSRDRQGLVMSGGDEGSSGQMVSLSEQPSGALVDGGDGRFIKEGRFYAGDGQVMLQVHFHILAVDAFQIASGDDSRCQRQRCPVHEFIGEIGLPCHDQGKPWFGILFELAEGMDFGQNLQPQQGGFVNHQDDMDFFATDHLHDFPANAFYQNGLGETGGIGSQFAQELAVKLDDGA